MADANYFGVRLVDFKEWLETFFEDNNPWEWNMHIGMRNHSINPMISDASVARILKFAQVLKIILQYHKRTNFQPIPLVESQV